MFQQSQTLGTAYGYLRMPCFHLLRQYHESVVVRTYTGGIEIYGIDYALQHGYCGIWPKSTQYQIPTLVSMRPPDDTPPLYHHYRPNIRQVNL